MDYEVVHTASLRIPVQSTEDGTHATVSDRTRRQRIACRRPVTVIAQASSIIERSEEDYVDQITDPCNGEFVQLIGTIKVTTRRTVDANGVVHLASNTVPSIRGEAARG